MISLLFLGLCLTTNLVLCNEECGDYVPGTDPMALPHTFCSPKPFNRNCSLVIPGSTWHYLKGYLAWGRCCLPVYGFNGTFIMCQRNGESDILTNCGEGLNNWNSPFSSVDEPFPYELSTSVCKWQTPLADSDIPRVSWKQQEYIIRNGKSVTLLAEVYSSTRVVIVSLFHDHKQFPVLSTNVTFHSQQYIYVPFTLSNVTTADDGSYYTVATNTRASGWSGKVHLTVITGTDQSVSSSSPKTSTSCMLMFVCMACMILRFIL